MPHSNNQREAWKTLVANHANNNSICMYTRDSDRRIRLFKQGDYYISGKVVGKKTFRNWVTKIKKKHNDTYFPSAKLIDDYVSNELVLKSTERYLADRYSAQRQQPGPSSIHSGAAGSIPSVDVVYSLLRPGVEAGLERMSAIMEEPGNLDYMSALTAGTKGSDDAQSHHSTAGRPPRGTGSTRGRQRPRGRIGKR